MTALDPAGVAGLEERALNAWPALQVALVGGWLARFADGYSKRANSACALPGAAPLAEVLPELEALYARRAQPCIIRLTPLAPPDSGALLDARGWQERDETSLQVAALPEPLPPSPALAIEPAAGPDWIDGYASASPRPDLRRDTLGRMLAAIGMPAAFATLRVEGEGVAYGLAVLERGDVGLFDIATAAAHRGRGHARQVVAGLLGWGASRGARRAYLQVTTANSPALRLYAGFGFREAYRYAYRLQA